MSVEKELCQHCDKGNPIHARGYCRNCYDRQLKLKNPEYAKRQNDNMKAWRLANQDKVKQREKERNQDPVYREKERIRKWTSLLAKYGLVQADYDQLVTEGCQLCGAVEAASYHLDHCHTTGKFRGLLCSKCNNGLGMLGDNLEGLYKAIKYLEKAEQTIGN
jgi:ribosomal protein L40E